MSEFINISISLSPNEQIFERELEREIGEVTDEVIEDVARLTPIEMRELLAGSPATGRRYGSHIASSKPNPPRNRSGELSASFAGKKTGAHSGEISMLWYGAYHDERGRSFIDKSFDNAIEKAL